MRWVLAIVAFLITVEALSLLNVMLKSPYPRRVCRQRSHDAGRLLYLYILVVFIMIAVIFAGR